MPNDKMLWVLLAPGLTSCFCFLVEDFVEGLREAWEEFGRCRRRIW